MQDIRHIKRGKQIVFLIVIAVVRVIVLVV